MDRNRAYHRIMRAKHIKRKKKLCSDLGNLAYEHDGMFSKGKVHCSCGMCMAKTRNKSRRHVSGNYAPSINYKHSDSIKVERMSQDFEDYLSS